MVTVRGYVVDEQSPMTLLIFSVDDPMPSTDTPTVDRRLKRFFANGFEMKFGIDAKSRIARALCVFP